LVPFDGRQVCTTPSRPETLMTASDVILHNGKVATVNPSQPEAQAVAMASGRFTAVGADGDVLKLRGPATRVVDLGGRRVIPALAKGPKLPPEHQANSTRHFMR